MPRRQSARRHSDRLRSLRRAAEAKRAVALAPIGARELDTEARIQAYLGNLDEALTLEHAAVAFLPETESSFEIQVHLAKIEQLARAKAIH